MCRRCDRRELEDNFPGEELREDTDCGSFSQDESEKSDEKKCEDACEGRGMVRKTGGMTGNGNKKSS